jgi:glycogen debranching enzyme
VQDNDTATDRPLDDYQISSPSERLDHRTRVLKHADSFVVLDRLGNAESNGPTEYGLFHQDTRHLSRLTLHVSTRGHAPHPLMLLGSAVKDDNELLFVHLTNPPIEGAQGAGSASGLPQGLLHLLRTQVLWRGALYERIRIHNYSGAPVRFMLHAVFDADFADIFEARGMRREHRGTLRPPRLDGQAMLFQYEGLDQRLRRTRVQFDTPPGALRPGRADFEIDLAPHAACCLRWTVHCESEDATTGQAAPPQALAVPAREPPWYEAAEERLRAEMQAQRGREPALYTSNSQFDQWLQRSLADLHMLATDTGHGRYPYAGVPWFSTPFGRDGIITALQCLWLAPDLARGVLQYLAAMQADRTDGAKDAQPGKILHETRGGEMAATGEVPFGCYYGSIDSTPLFVMLAGAYLERTADIGLVQALWPHVERALAWIDHHGDPDGDGFVEYARMTDRGLANQGWKDSHDAVFHDDGQLAEAPIALCEVQGYVYAARRAAAAMAAALGRHDQARALHAQADALRQRFDEAFWCEDIGSYAIALDGHKRPCRIRSSNAGQVLFSGIAQPDRAAGVAATLMSEPCFSGWGVRTVASTSPRYNPISYHNGSIWPHDNALIAAGLARYGHRDAAARILGGLFEASLHFDLRRLPELFCGFAKQAGEPPTLYPQACSPQAWAAAAPLMCLQACLGLEVDGARGLVSFRNPVMPRFLGQVHLQGLQLPQGSIDVVVTRHDGDVGVRLMRREGEVGLVVSM